MEAKTASPPRTRMTRKESQAETRRRLLDAAEVVFLRRGLRGASVEEIAAEAGFTRGAFYSNFNSKQELLMELFHVRAYDQYTRVAEQAHTREGTPRERLRWGAERLRDMQKDAEGGSLFKLWLECLTEAARDGDFRDLAATFWRGNRTLMTQQLRGESEAAGVEPPLPPKEIATAMIALDIGLAVQHLVDPDEVSLDLYLPLFEQLFAWMVEPG